MKKLCILNTILALMVLLTGCNQISLNSYTSLNEDGSGQFKFQVCYDELISKSLSNGIISPTKVAELKESGITSTKYYKNGYTYEEISYEISKLNNSENMLPDNKICVGSLEKKLGLREDTYTLKIAFNQPLIDSLSPLIDNVAIETLSYNSYSNISPMEYLKELPINNHISVPGQIINTNATEVIAPNTLSWGYKLGQVNEQTIMTVTYKINQPERYNMLVFSLVMLSGLFLLGVGYYVYKRKSPILK